MTERVLEEVEVVEPEPEEEPIGLKQVIRERLERNRKSLLNRYKEINETIDGRKRDV